MSGNGSPAFEQTVRRVEDLIAALAALPDPAAREPARELVEVVLDLHGGGLARLLELIAAAEGGQGLIERLAQDDEVKGLLLLHGLHPQDIETRVRAAVERLRPHLGVAGVRIEAVEVAGEAVRLRLRSGATTGAASARTLKQMIEDAIIEAAPDATDIRIDGLDSAIAFVPITSIKRQDIGQRSDVADHGP